MPQIIWSVLAKTDYWNNIDYLLQDWTEKEALSFIEKVDAVLQIITLSPKTFQKSGYKNTHFVPITPQITLYYRILNKQTVELVRFWNNYQDPKTRKL
jgi:plasmid stabilization system protein ParE